MRIVFIHPNYHSGGAEIAGNLPPAWVAYLAGSLKRAGFDDVHFLDAMTYHLGPDVLRAKLAELQPDIVGVEEAGLATGEYILAHRIPRLRRRCCGCCKGPWLLRS